MRSKLFLVCTAMRFLVSPQAFDVANQLWTAPDIVMWSWSIQSVWLNARSNVRKIRSIIIFRSRMRQQQSISSSGLERSMQSSWTRLQNTIMPCQKKENSGRNMAVTYINTKKIKSYCLGGAAIELNRKRAAKKLDQLEKREKEILSSRHTMQNQDVFLQSSLDYFKDYNLEANRECEHLNAELETEKVRYRELLEAQKNNAEFMALSQRVTDLEKQLRNKRREKTKRARRQLSSGSEDRSRKRKNRRDVSGERSGRAETSGRRTKAQSFCSRAGDHRIRPLSLPEKIKKAASCSFPRKSRWKNVSAVLRQISTDSSGVQQPKAGRRTSADRS